VLGTLLLTIHPSSDPEECIRPALSQEVRLFKYQLSNCFRKREQKDAAAAASVAAQATAATDMQIDAVEGAETNSSSLSSASSSTALSPSPSSSPSPSCLCSSYAPSSLGHLRCSNLFRCYSFENFVTQDLLQRVQKQPLTKFLLESREEGTEREGDEEDGQPQTNKQIFIRVSRTADNSQTPLLRYTGSSAIVSMAFLAYSTHVYLAALLSVCLLSLFLFLSCL
jgi:hypothetical protein